MKPNRILSSTSAALLAFACLSSVLQGTSAADLSNGAPSDPVALAESLPIDVYILAGQSNMSGRVSTGFTAVPGVDDDILYYYRTDGPASSDVTSGGTFTTLGTLSSGYYGPEISMARTLHAQSENKLAIIKISDGGTSLQVHWNSRASSGNVWWQHWVADTADAVADLKALGYTPVLKGIGWLQGESDQSEPGASNYEANFQNLIADMLSHLGSLMDVDGVRFVTALIKRSGTGAQKVRAAQVKVMDSVASWQYFDTMDLSFLADDAHFDEASVRIVGERFAQIFLAPPSVSITRDAGANFNVSALGVVYRSNDLVAWQRMDPQPASRWSLSPGPVGSIFYQARNR